MYRKLSFLVFTLALAAITGCLASQSSETISDSISSPFESSSGALGANSLAYREDVGDYTVAYLHWGGDLDAYRLGMTALANNRGISNWEEDAFTCRSIELGLQRANLDEAAIQSFARNLFGADGDKRCRLRAAYDLT